MSKHQIVDVVVAGMVYVFIAVLLLAITKELLSIRYQQANQQHIPADSTDMRSQLQSLQFGPSTRENDERPEEQKYEEN